MNDPTPAEMRLIVQVEELKERITVLARENAALRAERDIAMAKVMSLLPVATPEEEAEMQRAIETGIPNGLADLIAELEADGAGHDVR